MRTLKIIIWRLMIMSSVATVTSILIHRPDAAISAYNFQVNTCEPDCLKSLTGKGVRLCPHIYRFNDCFIHIFSKQLVSTTV